MQVTFLDFVMAVWSLAVSIFGGVAFVAIQLGYWEPSIKHVGLMAAVGMGVAGGARAALEFHRSQIIRRVR